MPDRAIEFTIAIRASAQTIWEHLTDPELIPAWNYMEAIECESVAVGGLMAYDTADENDEDGAEVLILEPPHHFAYRWFSSEPEPTLVEYRLEPDGPYTLLHFRNSGFKDGEAWDTAYGQDYEGWVALHLALREMVEK